VLNWWWRLTLYFSCLKCTFTAVGPSAWNSLPNDAQNPRDFSTFKSRFRVFCHFLHSYAVNSWSEACFDVVRCLWTDYIHITAPNKSLCCYYAYYYVSVLLTCFCLQWMQLRSRKQSLVRLFEQMQQYQFESQLTAGMDQPLESHVRALTDDDVDRSSHVCCVISDAILCADNCAAVARLTYMRSLVISDERAFFNSVSVIICKLLSCIIRVSPVYIDPGSSLFSLHHAPLL